MYTINKVVTHAFRFKSSPCLPCLATSANLVLSIRSEAYINPQLLSPMVSSKSNSRGCFNVRRGTLVTERYCCREMKDEEQEREEKERENEELEKDGKEKGERESRDQVKEKRL